MTQFPEAKPSHGKPRPVRIAQIGVAHSHAPGKWAALRKLREEFELVGLCEPSAVLRARAASMPEYAGARWLTEEQLTAEQLDAVVVEVDLPDILEFGCRAVEAGWHVHLDKPPGLDLAEFARLQTLAAARKQVIQTGYMFRYHPAFRFTFDAVRQGWLGRIFSITGDISSDIAIGRRGELERTYGSSTLLLGSHLIDLTMAILGEPQEVVAMRRRSYPERDGYSDNEIVLLGFKDASAVLRCLNAEFNPAKRRRFMLAGENGSLEIMPLEPGQVRLDLRTPAGGFAAGEQAVNVPAVTGRYDEMMQDFARLIRGEPSIVPQFDAAHELASHRTVLEIARRG